MLARKEEISLQLNQIIDSVILALTFWFSWWLRYHLPEWGVITNVTIAEFGYFLWVMAIVVPFTLFLGLLFLPFLYATLSFFYRWISLSRSSATPGMQLMAIHFRDTRGAGLDSGTALFHTLGYFVSVAVFPLQLISILMILMSERHQSLTDMVLGTTALNR